MRGDVVDEEDGEDASGDEVERGDWEERVVRGTGEECKYECELECDVEMVQVPGRMDASEEIRFRSEGR